MSLRRDLLLQRIQEKGKQKRALFSHAPDEREQNFTVYMSGANESKSSTKRFSEISCISGSKWKMETFQIPTDDGDVLVVRPPGHLSSKLLPRRKPLLRQESSTPEKQEIAREILLTSRPLIECDYEADWDSLDEEDGRPSDVTTSNFIDNLLSLKTLAQEELLINLKRKYEPEICGDENLQINFN
jgi:hypothetical protein